MPRRKRPLLRRATVAKADAEALRPAIALLLDDGKTLIAPPPRQAKPRLVDDLVDAVGFAMAGLKDILAGKRAKPAAWTADILVRDVCDALNRAGIKTPMDPDLGSSQAQTVAHALMVLAGLPDQGKLFHQMQRAKDIEKHKLPDVFIHGTIVCSSSVKPH